MISYLAPRELRLGMILCSPSFFFREGHVLLVVIERGLQVTLFGELRAEPANKCCKCAAIIIELKARPALARRCCAAEDNA